MIEILVSFWVHSSEHASSYFSFASFSPREEETVVRKETEEVRFGGFIYSYTAQLSASWRNTDMIMLFRNIRSSAPIPRFCLLMPCASVAFQSTAG